MDTHRLEAFSDGVLAIIITIMVLELKVPHGEDLAALWHTTGIGFLTYVLSFSYIGIYWNNHHHLFQLSTEVTGTVLWANLHLLFWLSLYPFTTAWMDETDLAHTPTVVYGVNLLAAAIAFYLLTTAMARTPDTKERMDAALGNDLKGKISPVVYIVGIVLAAYVDTRLALVPFVAVAVMWLVPDRRVERYLAAEAGRPGHP